MGSAVTVVHDSTHFDYGGCRLRSLVNGDEIHWGFGDDYEMFISLILRILNAK